ncbi:hydroxymethylbilane synthase [Corynebacterium sp. TAE3-ERU12]|uniref:hydroxymethylbilane synthase n=1 Tax=Corynebacterium sp. TAE3-ERU12 TaxID=2849491 RepID=UPI00351CCEF3
MSDSRETDAQRTIRIGTRGSELAMTQAGHVRDALIANGHPAELVIIKTAGDHNRNDPVQKIGVGVFTQALRLALRNGDCDVAVHSFKDLPTAGEADLTIAAVPPRVDAREVLVSRNNATLRELPDGAAVGTSAPRRVSQLLAIRPDLDLRPVRGNIDTRMNRVHEDLDAVVLARAGLERTGRLNRAAESLAISDVMPAPAQGALAVECRSSDSELVAAVAELDDPHSHARAVAERQVLEVLQAGCTAPVGAYAHVNGGDELVLTAGVFAIDGTAGIVRTATGNVLEPVQLGTLIGQRLLEAGAHEVMGDTLR